MSELLPLIVIGGFIWNFLRTPPEDASSNLSKWLYCVGFRRSASAWIAEKVSPKWMRIDEAILHAAQFSNLGQAPGSPLKSAIKDGFRGAAFRARLRVRGQLVIDDRTTTRALVDIPASYWETHELDDHALRYVLTKPETIGIVYPETSLIGGAAPGDKRYTDLFVRVSDVLVIWPRVKMGGPLDMHLG